MKFALVFFSICLVSCGGYREKEVPKTEVEVNVRQARECELVDNFETINTYTPAGEDSHAASLTTDLEDNVYVLGSFHRTTGAEAGWVWVVRISRNGGNSWQTFQVALFSDPSQATTIGRDTEGNLYASGLTDGELHVFKSSDGGRSWAEVNQAFGETVSNDSDKNIFAVANVESFGVNQWRTAKRACVALIVELN